MARFDSLLEKKLTKPELSRLKTSLDILGEIAVIEIPKELAKKEKIIGSAVLKANPQLRAVFKKASPVKGEYRIRMLKKIAGKGSALTAYRENSCFFRFDASEVFFTPRLSSERLRIAKQVKPGETVLDMFAGVGPFTVLIAKSCPKVSVVYAIDSNKKAIKYLEESAAMNRVSHKIRPFIGDAAEVVKLYLKNTSSRVIMNLPKTNKTFFADAISALRAGRGILHFYTFASDGKEVQGLIKKSLKKHNFTILKIIRLRQYSPRVWNFVADIQIRKPKLQPKT